MKSYTVDDGDCTLGSAPTRGPWIEISRWELDLLRCSVGPHTGAVD